eukprot:gnl/TRDRNA2_/TRDRNA2_142208_c0_seq1.p1 gnl/TRDRNA2_/TRDRNA2_142208_c0~~gnl/TRDRNA2_/TRDRNA2_142208_c0_seq1.p1  ORF type:complete len:196 (-),score=52.62 gnl/TRDRNA2_/TRDRNA2_142208_c0_seq1:78-665(-)
MGKNAHRTKVGKQRGTAQQRQEREKRLNRHLKKKKGGKKKGAPASSTKKQETDGDDVMRAAPVREAGERLVAALAKAKQEAKANKVLQSALLSHPGPDAMGAALGHCAGRGLESSVRLLIASKAPLDAQDPSQVAGRNTPLQLAASRGHVEVCRLLVDAGADRTGAMEAAHALSELGATFKDERMAIEAILGHGR